ncbi:MAG: hypothetical protein EOO28_13105 [Comamonadaceae bacterium]|nr:MAG: hypothetical protein EOO28_13105 [Comamonadaceae bacterium]
MQGISISQSTQAAPRPAIRQVGTNPERAHDYAKLAGPFLTQRVKTDLKAAMLATAQQKGLPLGDAEIDRLADRLLARGASAAGARVRPGLEDHLLDHHGWKIMEAYTERIGGDAVQPSMGDATGLPPTRDMLEMALQMSSHQPLQGQDAATSWHGAAASAEKLMDGVTASPRRGVINLRGMHHQQDIEVLGSMNPLAWLYLLDAASKGSRGRVEIALPDFPPQALTHESGPAGGRSPAVDIINTISTLSAHYGDVEVSFSAGRPELGRIHLDLLDVVQPSPSVALRFNALEPGVRIEIWAPTGINVQASPDPRLTGLAIQAHVMYLRDPAGPATQPLAVQR